MTNTPHTPVTSTPGPWIVQRNIISTNEAAELVGYNSDGEPKFNVFVEAPAYNLAGVSGIGRAECLANARLIASAPELFEALRAMTAWIEDKCHSVCCAHDAFSSCPVCHLTRQAQAALAKANP